MKKLISLIVALAIATCCIVSASAADPDVTIVGLAGLVEVDDDWYVAEATESSLEVEPGDLVRVEWIWTLSEAMEAADERVGAFNCSVSYDSNALELSSQDYEDPDTEWAMGDAFLDFASDRKMKYTGSTMLWNINTNPILGGFTNASGVGYKANDMMWISAQFKVKDSAVAGAYPITLSVDPLTNAGVGSGLRDLTPSITNCQIVVAGGDFDPDKADKDAAKAVDDKIDAIGTVTLASEGTITEARAAYTALTEKQKGFVTKLDTLTAAETALAALKAQADQDAADEVSALIDAIGTVTLDSEADITAARVAFDALTDVQKDLVDNLATLTTAEETLAALKEAKVVDDVKDMINSLPEASAVTPADKAAIEAARAAYDALADEQKDQVDTTKLEAAEEALANYEVNQVIAAIEDLPSEVTLDDKDAVDAAKNAYDQLSDAGKEKIDDTLKTKLNNAIDAIKALLDAKAAKEVDDAIVAAESETQVVAARAAYDALTDAQKALVTELDTLTEKENAIAKAKADKAAAKAVDDAIEAIGDVTLDKEDEITAARAAYEDLTDDQKDLVTKLDDLVAKETALAQAKADKAAADVVNEQIRDAEEESEVNEARAAYNALTEAQKAYIDQLPVLEAKEAAIQKAKDDKKAADDVTEIINELPEAEEITEDDIADVEEALNEYNGLTDDQKALVSENAKTKLEAVSGAVDVIVAAKAAAIIDELDEEITLDSEEAIKAARKAYDDLTDSQKALVAPETLEKLVNAEAALKELKDAQLDLESDLISGDDTDKNVSNDSDNYDTGDSSAVAVAGGLCALMAAAFVFTKKKFRA